MVLLQYLEMNLKTGEVSNGKYTNDSHAGVKTRMFLPTYREFLLGPKHNMYNIPVVNRLTGLDDLGGFYSVWVGLKEGTSSGKEVNVNPTPAERRWGLLLMLVIWQKIGGILIPSTCIQ